MKPAYVIKLCNKKVDYQAVENYMVWLQCGMKMNPFNYNNHRAVYHAAIFESVGYSRVSAPDKFNRALDSLICDMYACSKCSLTTNNEGYCQECKLIVTIDDMVKRLKKLRSKS